MSVQGKLRHHRASRKRFLLQGIWPLAGQPGSVLPNQRARPVPSTDTQPPILTQPSPPGTATNPAPNLSQDLPCADGCAFAARRGGVHRTGGLGWVSVCAKALEAAPIMRVAATTAPARRVKRDGACTARKSIACAPFVSIRAEAATHHSSFARRVFGF